MKPWLVQRPRLGAPPVILCRWLLLFLCSCCPLVGQRFPGPWGRWHQGPRPNSAVAAMPEGPQLYFRPRTGRVGLASRALPLMSWLLLWSAFDLIRTSSRESVSLWSSLICVTFWVTRAHFPLTSRPPLPAYITQDLAVHHDCAGTQLRPPCGVQMVALDCLYLVRLSATLLRVVGSFTVWGWLHSLARSPRCGGGVGRGSILPRGQGFCFHSHQNVRRGSELTVHIKNPTLALLSEGHNAGRYNFIFFFLPFFDHENFTLALLIRKLIRDIEGLNTDLTAHQGRTSTDV